MEVATILQEVTIIAPVEAVWRALTDHNYLREWFYDIPDFKPQVGTEFSFYSDKKNHRFRAICRVVKADPLKKLAYTWTYDDIPVETLVTFELFEKGDDTRVKLSHEGLDRIPSGNEELSPESHLEGWHHILKSLKEYVEATPGI